MKRKRFSVEQIAFALWQAEQATLGARVTSERTPPPHSGEIEFYFRFARST